MKFLRKKMTETKKAKELVKLLERLIEKDYLYSEENIRQMKSQLRFVKQQIANIDKNNSKGFGE
jgi:hypothetical protein